MAKETRYAGIVCLVLTIISLAGILSGIKFEMPIIIALVLLPPSVYEVYRTEGIFTKIASLLILGIVFTETILIAGKISINIIEFAKKAGAGTVKFSIPPVDLKTAGAAAGAVLAIFLLKRTGGRYTIWLAVIILAGMLSLVYALNPELLNQILHGNFRGLIKNML